MTVKQAKLILYAIIKNAQGDLYNTASKLYYSLDEDNLEPMAALIELSEAIGKEAAQEKAASEKWKKETFKKIDSVKLCKELRREITIQEIKSEIENF